MCYFIESDNLMANYFAANAKKKKITIPELRKLKDYLADNLKPNAFFNVKYESISRAVDDYPEFFDIKNITIEKKKNITITFVEGEFNCLFPKEFKKQYSGLLKKYDSATGKAK